MDYREAERILSCVVGRLNQERERQDISLQKLGKISGVSRKMIGMMEKGERSPSLVVCLRVADALGLKLEDVLKSVPSTKGKRK